ncbi:MAG TPA: class I SAM-dependent methyltransferase [Anaerolineales bacterium]|nr:class I SAM-dependent methyltransferase [Anaerolineales bacterium]
MKSSDPELEKIKNYFVEKLEQHGATPRGVDYNSAESQYIRFDQLIKVVDTNVEYSLLDFGSGYGGMYDYLKGLGHNLRYIGYDIAEPMIDKGRELHSNDSACKFVSRIEDAPMVDYSVVSGTFNIKLDADFDAWTQVIIESLYKMNERSRKGMSFNMLTRYSDPEKMRPDLYYADPLFFFDFCKKNFSRNVALLHDYGLYDFTILVRKDV